MKKLNVLKIVKLFITLLLIVSINTNIYASWVEEDDETADAKAKNQLEQQEKEIEESFGKSNNNYLKEITVKGYNIEPKFDKQTVNYTISEEIQENFIEIIAYPDDEKSSVSGKGKVELKEGENTISINITAENGSVRSYFIKVNKKTNPNENNENEKLETKSVAAPISKEENTNSTSPNSNNENTATFIILGIVFVIIVLALLKPKKKRRAKKTRR